MSLDWDLIDGLKENMKRIAALGLEVQITELDISCAGYPNYNCGSWTETEMATQAALYGSLLQACLDEPACTDFETWGFTDKYTWMTSVAGSNQHPLPYNETFAPKPAFDSLLSTLENSTGNSPASALAQLY